MGQKIRFTVLEGNERNCGEPLRLLFSGSPAERYDIIDRAFDEGGYRVCFKARLPIALFRSAVRANLFRCDLMFFQHQSGKEYSPQAEEFISPLWVRASASLPLNPSTKSAKSDIRKVFGNGLVWSVVRDTAAVEVFCTTMWGPMVKKRYPFKNVDEDLDSWTRYESDLLQISDSSGWIAGALIRYDGTIPHVWRLGIKNGDLSLWNKGVSAAVYYFTSEYLYSKGYEEVSYGLSRAFLNDGVLQYKKKWGIVLDGFQKYLYAIRVLRKNRAVASFFLHNPFCCILGNKLVAAIFIIGEQVAQEEISRYRSRYSFDGINELHIYNVLNLRLVSRTLR
ncbi:hypothetical protein Paes_0345 [Prosthecochloris aestuarii DSM 271]|uniref:BioF2-like acetyltransferase domain-containing protein n=1 Tax=Prosthecochloris aestuarii (strain DSM 271 / SK 413) TaxID=290512 RepID=B4S4F4_PROA2|nr:hypothetical protein [Prosthecochloris aestuarii]ACF45402.1 hypothetical protein Paes_0345 [Prosthecochloris aestuarii DSM 271]